MKIKGLTWTPLIVTASFFFASVGAFAGATISVDSYKPGYPTSSKDTLTSTVVAWEGGEDIPLDPTICRPGIGCVVGVGWHKDGTTRGSLVEPFLTQSDTANARTVGDLQRIWGLKFGYGVPQTRVGLGISSDVVCVAMKYMANQSTGDVNLMPGSECVWLQPGPGGNLCYFDTDVMIDHGIVPAAQIEQSFSSGKTTVRCLYSATLRISMPGLTTDGELRINDDITSKLTVNGVNGKVGVVLELVSEHPYEEVRFDSTLSKVAGVMTPTGGEYEAATAAILNIL